MKTLEINQKKAFETKVLLLEVIKEPSSFKDNDGLKIALKSQRGLANFSDENRGIEPCSLNTLKNASELVLDRGFVELNELRINAKDAIEGASVGIKVSKSTRVGLRNTVDDLELKLSLTQESNVLLSTIVSELRRELKVMAYSTARLKERQETYQFINSKVEAKLSYIGNREV
jgi:hypothetical protein